MWVIAALTFMSGMVSATRMRETVRCGRSHSGVPTATERVMTKKIETETLRDWLDRDHPVTVLDIRTDDDRAQWAIPGSVHVNAYEALRAGLPGALADATFPLDRPVVTVCNAGRVSQTAAEMLAKRGFDARSLAGGMKAWSLAWNAADVPLADPSVRVIQVRRTGKGCLWYIVASAGEAAVIDPSVSPDVYVELARRHGWSIRYVLETHVHADHLSRARELVTKTGATLLLPPQQRVRFAFTRDRRWRTRSVGRRHASPRRTRPVTRTRARPTS